MGSPDIKCFHCLMDSGCCWGKRDQIRVQKDKTNTSLSPRGSSTEQREHLGSAPSHLTYPSKTSPSEPKLSLISKANVGTAPFPVPALFYVSPRVFPIPAKPAPLQSPLPSPKKGPVLEQKRKGSHQKRSAARIAGLHVFCESSSHG